MPIIKVAKVSNFACPKSWLSSLGLPAAKKLSKATASVMESDKEFTPSATKALLFARTPTTTLKTIKRTLHTRPMSITLLALLALNFKSSRFSINHTSEFQNVFD